MTYHKTWLSRRAGELESTYKSVSVVITLGEESASTSGIQEFKAASAFNSIEKFLLCSLIF